MTWPLKPAPALALLLVLVSRTARAEEPPPEPSPTPAAPPPSPASAGPPESSPEPAPTPNEDAPIGRAAPPTEAATRGEGAIRAGMEIFAQYAYRNTSGPSESTWHHVFDVPRVHGAVEGRWERTRGRLVLEATRSASEGSLIGVAGDSLVLRVREAFAEYRPVDALELAAGVVPVLTVPELDGTWMMRPVAPSGLEQNGLLAPADLGARARFVFPRGYGFIGTGAYNGEGYSGRELNRGKNVEGAVEVHPLAAVRSLLPFGAFLSYSLGSTGAGSVRADRLTFGVVWQDARVRAGLFVTRGRGFGQLGRQGTLLASAFVRVEPVRRLLLGARVDHVVRDTDSDPEDAISSLWFSAGYRLATPLETFLAMTRAIPTSRAESELPGTRAWELRLVARVVF